MTDVRRILADNRLVTLTGAGGVGKTRLALEVAGRMMGECRDGVWYVDLAPITDPDLVPVAVARALGLPDQPGRSTMETLLRFIGDRQMLVVLDNCEHLLDACAALIVALLGACPGLTLLTTSREPIGVAGEVTWRVRSLSLADEAIELFTDRARHVRPDFHLTDDNTTAVTEICRRLDGMPLAIELAAARIRALSLTEILDSLHDRFRLLTGGARTAVRRQQTLRASVDWSYAADRARTRRVSPAGCVPGRVRPRRHEGRRRRRRGAAPTRCWTCLPCSSTSRWSWPKTQRAERDTGCWRRCASTRWKSWASPARPTPCARATATTTRRWRRPLSPRPFERGARRQRGALHARRKDDLGSGRPRKRSRSRASSMIRLYWQGH